MAVHHHMFQWQSVGFSGAELRSKPCWCDCASLPVPAARPGWKEHRQPQGSHLQPRKRSQGGNLWDWAGLWSSCLRICPRPGPRSCQDLLVSLTLCHHNHLCQQWMLAALPHGYEQGTTTWEFPTTENKVVYEDKKMEVTVWITKAVQSQIDTSVWKIKHKHLRSLLGCYVHCSVNWKGRV